MKKVLMILLTTVLIFGYTALPAMAESRKQKIQNQQMRKQNLTHLEEGYTEENDGYTSVVALGKKRRE